MTSLALVFALLLCAQGIHGGNHNYWWMSDPGVFSSGQNQGHQSNNFESQDNSNVETECPVGTKCVADHFCNEHAVMVSSRVQLTPTQKRNRGKLIPCVNTNGGLDVCCSTASPSSSSQTFNSGNNQQFGNLQEQPSSFSSSSSIPSGECPNMANLPPVESCANKASDCWSVGQADVDCPNNALCCFDGCVNACYYGGSSRPAPAQSFPAPPAQSYPAPPPPAPAPPPRRTQTPVQSPPARVQSYIPPAVQEPPQTFSNHVPEQSYIPPQPQRPAFQPQQPARPQTQSFSPPQKQTSYQPVQQSGSFESAETKPFVTCPSAMKCVPRENCDFNGVMTDQTLRLTPDLEMLRVPLIPCVNPMTTNIEVCCRDPNYQDPWPDMNNGNNNGNFAGNNGNNNNQGHFGGNNGGGNTGGLIPRVDNGQNQPKRNSYGK